MKQVKERNRKIDNLRAIAIIIVVLGHSIILYSKSWGIYQSDRVCEVFDYLKDAINLLQMPLFFSLSGFLFTKSTKNELFLPFTVKKIKRLIIPFLFVGLVYMIPLKLFLHYPGYQGISYFGAVKRFINGYDMGHLWFLPTLFLYFIITFWIKKVAGNKSSLWVTVTIFAALLSSVTVGSGPYVNYLNFFLDYYWSFAFGSLIGGIDLQKISNRGKLYIACVTVLTFTAALFFDRKILSFAASGLLTFCCYLFITNANSNIFMRISKNSFGIYLLHSPLIYITFTYMLNAEPVLVFIVNFFVFGSISFILSEWFSKTPVKYLLGQWS